MSERRRLRAQVSPESSQRRVLVEQLEALTVAAVASVRLGNPAGEAYRRACVVAAGLGFTDLPPLDVLVERYMEGPFSVAAWSAPPPVRRRGRPR